MKPIRVGIVGVGKIARDQHIPAILGNSAFIFAAAASRHAQAKGVANFSSIEEMLAKGPDLDAVAICTPPQAHYEAAKLALAKGKHVLLEKPPCTSLTQFENLVRLARIAGRTLYQTWHSRHARAGGSRGASAAATNSAARMGDLERGCAPMASRADLDLGAGRLRRARSRDQCHFHSDPDHPRTHLCQICPPLCAVELRSTHCGGAGVRH